MRGPIAVITVLGALLAAGSASGVTVETVAVNDPRPEARTQIEFLERATWRLERLMGKRRTQETLLAGDASVETHVALLRFWEERYTQVLRAFRRPPRLQDWLCIHKLEAPWDDPDPPYYGGLQMDIEFQRSHGGDLLKEKGTAENWSPLEQIWVAVRAWRERGFSPWPNTARECGAL